MSTRRKFKTREQWLAACVEKLRPLFKRAGYNVPARVRMSCGWPSVGATRKRRRIIGQAWSHGVSADKTGEIFVSPILDKTADVMSTLIHELVHVTVGTDKGHGPAFRACALAVGLLAPMRSTPVGPHLARQLRAIGAKLGIYPHGALSPVLGHVPQGTRMRKLECPGCGYVVRTTSKWIETGLPTCVCGEDFEAADG